MSWLAKLDARAAQWPAAAKWPYRVVKWTLVASGAAGVIATWIDRMGWQAALWFLLAPIAYGAWIGITELRSARSERR